MNFNRHMVMENGMGPPQHKFQGPQRGLGRGRGGPRFPANPGFRGRGCRPNDGQFRGRASCHQGPEFRKERPLTRQDLELNKPWIHGFLAREIKLTYELKENAGQTKRQEDFRSFADQRDKVRDLVKNFRDKYFTNNPGQESHWLPILALESSQLPFTCDNCEMEFSSENDLLGHELKHEVCGLDGCTYTVLKNKLEIHILHMHASGLYNRARTGDTPEDIEKWRTERKKNFPSAAKTKEAERRKQLKDERKRKYLDNLKQKQVEIEAKKRKKQEELKSRSRSRKRGRKRKAADGHPNLIDVKEVKTAGSGDQPLPFWFGNIQKFRGTKFHLQSESAENLPEEPVVDDQGFHISDEEWDVKPKTCAVDVQKVTANHEILDRTSDDEPPEEHPSSVNRVEELAVLAPVPLRPRTESRKTSKRQEKCDAPKVVQPRPGKTTFTREAVEKRLMQRNRRPHTLLEKLLNQDIETETEELLQCLRYVCMKNFFDDSAS